jgi:hypothetical protein
MPAVSNILAKNVTGCVNLAAKFMAYQSTAAPAQITSGVQALNRPGLFRGLEETCGGTLGKEAERFRVCLRSVDGTQSKKPKNNRKT